MSTTHNHSNVPDINFYDWLDEIVHSPTGLPILVLVVFLLSVLSEGLGASIKRLRARPVFWLRSRGLTVVIHNLLSTGAHAARVALMFVLMVVFMAMNAWLCVSMLLGAAVGHLVLNWSSVWESEAPDKEELARAQW
jgi:hypothetical protein